MRTWRSGTGSDPWGLTPVLVAVALVLLATACGGEERPALPEGRALAVNASVSPAVALFADPIEARVDVLVDGEELDPERIRFEPDFAPYELLGDPVLEREDLGRYTRLRYAYTLRCLTLDCIQLLGGGPAVPQPGGIPPPVTGAGGFGERKSIQMKAAALRYDDPEGERVLRRVRWEPVQSVSRLNFADTTQTGIGFPFRASVTPLPEATLRVPPWLLGGVLLLAAAALLAVPAVVVRRALRRPPAEVEEAAPELTPLERAIALVERARGDGDVVELRESLEVLAVELDAASRDGLARPTRALAWSATPPTADAAGELLDEVREEPAHEEDDGPAV